MLTFFHIQISVDILSLSVSSRVIGQYNREERVCYIPVGDNVHPFSGDGIEVLVNHLEIRHPNAAAAYPAPNLSGIAGTISLKIFGRFCSNT